MGKADPVHQGHRRRLRERFLSQGPEGMEESKLLELILYVPMRRRDASTLACQLLRRFGSLSGVLSASYQDLLDIPGVGEETAFCLSAFLPISRRVAATGETYEPPVLLTPEDMTQLVQERADPPGAPAFFALLLDEGGGVRGFRCFSGTRLPSVRRLAQCLVDSGLPRIALAEYYIGCKSSHLPRALALVSALQTLGCGVWDYQFIEEQDTCSLRAEGLLPKKDDSP